MRRAFTLVETLCVLGIIALLAGLLLPLLAPSRRAARVTAAAANLRQHAVAVSLYRSAENGEGVYSSQVAAGLPPTTRHYSPRPMLASGCGPHPALDPQMQAELQLNYYVQLYEPAVLEYDELLRRLRDGYPIVFDLNCDDGPSLPGLADYPVLTLAIRLDGSLMRRKMLHPTFIDLRLQETQ